MFRLSALNEQTNSSSNFENDAPKGTKEAQEAYAFNLYNNALQLQRDERHEDAISVYEDLLKTQLVTNAATTLVDENGEATERPLKDPGLILKYSTHKNMASMAADKGDINTAMEHYLQAVMLDPTDVTLWHRIGTHAITLGRLALARHAFTSGLACNENYWPCLDAAITVLYALSDYESCLHWIAKALQKDYGFIKGLVFREKMFIECPHLRSDYQWLFKDCSLMIYDVEIDETEAMQFINEAVQLREQHRKLCISKPPTPCNLLPPLSKLSWINLGECLLATYDLIINSSEYSLISPVRFGNVQLLRENPPDKVSTMETKNDEVKTQTPIDADKEKFSDEMLKDENSLASQSAEDSIGFSEDSVLSSGINGEPQNNVFSSYFSLSQEINTNQDLEEPFDNSVISDIINCIIQAVCSSLEEDEMNAVVADVVENLVASAVSNNLTDKDIVKEIVEKIVDSIENNFFNFTLLNDDPAVTHSQEDALNEDDDKLKKTSKKKKFLSENATDKNMKRRSNRVRISSKKQKPKNVEPETNLPSLNYKQEIINILPKEFALLPPVVNDEDVNDDIVTVDAAISCKLNNSYVDESDDVLSFLESNEGNFIINILQSYYTVLSTKVHLRWEEKTGEVIKKIFIKTRPHFSPVYLQDIDDPLTVKKLLFSILTCVECLVDGNTQRKRNEKRHLAEINEHIDLLMSAVTSYQHLLQAVDVESELFENKARNRDWKAFSLRVLWLRIQHDVNIANYEEAVNNLELCSEIFSTVRSNAFSSEPFVLEPADSYVIELPNLKNHPVISLSSVNKRLLSLEQTKLFESANNFYERENFVEVIRILKPTVLRPFLSKAGITSRPKQLRQLLLSCQYLPDFSSLAQVSGHVLNEVMTSLKEAENLKKKKKFVENGENTNDTSKQWSITLNITLQALDKAAKTSEKMFEEASLDDRSRLCYALTAALDYLLASMERGKFVNNAILSWILLYKVLLSIEKDGDVIASENPPPSLLMLSTAHKWLGEKSLCCSCDGTLLKFFTSEITRRFSYDHDFSFKNNCDEFVEQCFYCMFGFPNKPKSKRIEEHTAKPLPLTWKNSLDLFRHFRPAFLPEFDSYKTSTVSQELSQLLHRILPLAPSQVSNRIPNSESSLNDFIENNCDDARDLKPAPSDDDVIMLSDMYYLLADYYFKNNEMSKALKFYSLDLRVNPTRFDAWAGMALARSSQIDDRLRLCETKKSQQKAVKDSSTERRGFAALACFKRALSFDSNNAKLWIEYGSLSYWIHSMISRKIKRSDVRLEEDDLKKKKMLSLSKQSFQKALDCEGDEIHDEEWLIHYMLGKISEKQGSPLKDYIKLYQTSADMLHRRQAKYPKKIQAKYAFANDLAIEALEMHFRIHASILKYALRHPLMLKEEQIFINDVIEGLKNSPFVTRNEAKQDAEKGSKLVVTSQSSHLTMGSLLPDNILQALNIEEPKTDDDSQSSACSLAPANGHSSRPDSATLGRFTQNVNLVYSVSNGDLHPDQETPEPPKNFTTDKTEKTEIDCNWLIDACESAFRLCAHRFPHHYKSVYRLARIYSTCPGRKRLSWSRDLLYGASSPWQQLRHMPAPGLLADRNKTNLFNGVWRIPIDDIDRPGSFSSHLNRCLLLLLDVLRLMEDNEALLHIHNLLHRTPDHGKKYLREEDRILLARRALVFCRGILFRKICALSRSVSTRKSFAAGSSPPESPRFTSSIENTSTEDNRIKPKKEVVSMVDSVEKSLDALMDAYKVYQDTLKHIEATTKVDTRVEPDDKGHQQLLLEAYHQYTCLTRNDDSSVTSATNSNLEEALRFCNQQNALRKAAATSTSTANKSLTSSTTSTSHHQTNNSRPVATVAPQKRPDDKTPSATSAEKTITKHENSENGLNLNESRFQLADKPNKGQITMVADQGGRTYTRIAPPSSGSVLPTSGGASQPERDVKRLRLDPGLRHLQDSTKKLIRSTSVPLRYAEGEENTPPPHRLLCRTGSCVSDSTKRKLKNTILAKTSAALVRKPSITDHEMHQLRVRLDPYDSESSESEDEDEFAEEDTSSGRKRKYSEDATPPVSTNEHPPLLSTHQSSVITTAEST